jgi:hypothetical protein
LPSATFTCARTKQKRPSMAALIRYARQRQLMRGVRVPLPRGYANRAAAQTKTPGTLRPRASPRLGVEPDRATRSRTPAGSTGRGRHERPRPLVVARDARRQVAPDIARGTEAAAGVLPLARCRRALLLPAQNHWPLDKKSMRACTETQWTPEAPRRAETGRSSCCQPRRRWWGCSRSCRSRPRNAGPRRRRTGRSCAARGPWLKPGATTSLMLKPGPVAVKSSAPLVVVRVERRLEVLAGPPLARLVNVLVDRTPPADAHRGPVRHPMPRLRTVRGGRHDRPPREWHNSTRKPSMPSFTLTSG